MAIKSFGRTSVEVDGIVKDRLSSVDQDITPDGDNTRALGSSSNRFSNIHAQSVYGNVHWADLIFQEKRCDVCGEKFEVDDTVILTVNKVVDNGEDEDGTYLLPIHKSCS